MSMVNGKLKNGFAFQLDENVLDNMELVEAIAEAEENPVGLVNVVRMILGDDQKKRLYEHLRTEDGRVPVGAVNDSITEILNSTHQGKN